MRTTMLLKLRKRIYTAEAIVKGGRQGHGRTSDGVLDLDVRLPVEMGGKGGGANPEQFFAVGYGACFQSAIAEAGRRPGLNATESTVTSRVSIGLTEGGSISWNARKRCGTVWERAVSGECTQ
jgi:Ohr subfamily peroxiredoxin